MTDSKQHSVFRQFVNNHTLGGLKVIPVYRKMGPKSAGADAFERARDIEEVLDALPGLIEQLEATQKALAAAVDVAIWLTGLPCLNPESEAWSYWESGARPKLYKAMELLDSNPASEPEAGWEDDVAISLEIQKRDATDDGSRISIEQLEAEVSNQENSPPADSS